MESEEGQYKKTQDETAVATPHIPIPAYSSIVSIMESGYNPFHVVLGEEFLPLGYFSLENFWGQPLITEPAEAFVSTQGVIHMKLRWGYRIDLTMNKGIRVINEQSQIALAVSCDGNSMSMVHPMGCVRQEDQKIDIKLNNSDLDFPNLTSNPKFAKMNSSSSGIMFKCKLSPLGFVVDEAGVRSSMQRYYNEFKEDPTVTTFYDKAVTGPTYLESAAVILRATVRWVDFWGVDHWLINGVHITQTYDGSVGVKYGNNDEYDLRTSDLCGTAHVSTPLIYCTASLGGYNSVEKSRTTPHLFVIKKDDGLRRVFADGNEVSFRVGQQTAKMDKLGNLMMIF